MGLFDKLSNIGNSVLQNIDKSNTEGTNSFPGGRGRLLGFLDALQERGLK